MTDPDVTGVRVLAGAPGKDRTTIARPSAAPRWFEPMHVREPARVREEMAGQIVAGATVLLAPTWLTHRRALVPVGETRRSQEWTSLAVSVAREASEIGRERRGEGPSIVILGVLPDPDAIDEDATGRQLRPDSAAERDERAQAGILAESGIEGVLIEARPSLDRARVAVRAVIEHDLAAWIAIPERRADGLPLQAWVDALAADGVGMLLFEALDVAHGDRPPEGPFGFLSPGPLPAGPVEPRAVASAWIERGARVLGIAADATPESLRPLVEARDTAIAAATQAAGAELAELDAWIGDAARRAAGGRALWIGDEPRTLPNGFDWTSVPRDAIAGLPASTWRLLISVDMLDPRDGARIVERGGIVAGLSAEPGVMAPMAAAAGLRLDQVTPRMDGTVRYIGRREA